ncbi:uncharacterized protein L201_001164 [Kwoniella dendrophila CBS 6074]|uniref:Uncharacterized protein n=1 Tax=Kwoniella dendrophila CBS 6074 TaxID=1295534 RepID=A0AAX4JLK3_9TREE
MNSDRTTSNASLNAQSRVATSSNRSKQETGIFRTHSNSFEQPLKLPPRAHARHFRSLNDGATPAVNAPNSNATRSDIPLTTFTAGSITSEDATDTSQLRQYHHRNVGPERI